jgi:hypothetical protein
MLFDSIRRVKVKICCIPNYRKGEMTYVSFLLLPSLNESTFSFMTVPKYVHFPKNKKSFPHFHHQSLSTVFMTRNMIAF